MASIGDVYGGGKVFWISPDGLTGKVVSHELRVNNCQWWSVLYFGLKNPFYAFIEIFVLWISIVSMIYVTYKIDKKAGWLLVPYLLWVSFAIVLNYLSIK